MSFDPVSYLMGQISGGGPSQPESIDLWEKAMLDGASAGQAHSDKNGNNSLQENHLNTSMLWHLSGTFSNTKNITIGWYAPKATCDLFEGKYLNLKVEGTYPPNIRGRIQANVSPWADQAFVNLTTRKCLVSEFPSGTYTEVFVGFMIDANVGDTIDAYIELTITDD